MTAVPDVQPGTKADTEQFIRDLAAVSGRPAPAITWTGVASRSQVVNRLIGPPEIQLSDDILNSRAEARFTAAHEMGHMVHRHHQGIGLIVQYLAFGATVLVVAGGAAVVAAWAGVETAYLPGIGSVVWALGFLPVTAIMLRLVNHPREYACDRYAADQGAVLNSELAAYLATSPAAQGQLHWHQVRVTAWPGPLYVRRDGAIASTQPITIKTWTEAQPPEDQRP